MVKNATFRFYEELNDFLPSEKKKIPFPVAFTGNPSVKSCIESLGVPHTEVDLILINGESVPFSYHVQDGDLISIYPEFESFDISGVTRLREIPLRKTKFIVDSCLGKLAKYLRLSGFDCFHKNKYTDTEIIEIAETEKRIILTKTVSLLKNQKVCRGYLIRSHDPYEQAREVIRRFDLYSDTKPFSRCMVCNGIVTKINKNSLLSELEPATVKHYSEFTRCTSCNRIYRKGSPAIRLRRLIEGITKKNTKEWVKNQE